MTFSKRIQWGWKLALFAAVLAVHATAADIAITTNTLVAGSCAPFGRCGTPGERVFFFSPITFRGF
jgi:hypothetical protein